MKDLQELFESLGTTEFDKLAELADKKSLNPKNAKMVLDYVAQVYCGEKNVVETELSAEEIEELLNTFYINIALYKSVTEGHMEIITGRIMLTDGNSCQFKLTPEGIKHVENNLLPQIKG